MEQLRIDDEHPRHRYLQWVIEALGGTVVDCAGPEVLIAVFCGQLEAPTHGKRPTLFWPVLAASEDEPSNVEDTGIYLHRDRFQPSLASPGRNVLHVVQGPVIVNVRGA